MVDTSYANPSISPDGLKLAYISGRSGLPEIWIQDLVIDENAIPVDISSFAEPEGSDLSSSHSGNHGSSAPEGSDDSLNHEGSDVSLGIGHHARMASKEAVLLRPRGLELPYTAHSCSWSPDGRYIVCEISPGNSVCTEVWLIDIDDKTAEGVGATRLAGEADRAGGALNAVMGVWDHSGKIIVVETDTTSVVTAISIPDLTKTVYTSGELIRVLEISPNGEWLLLRVGPRSYRHLVAVRLSDHRWFEVPCGKGSGSTELATFLYTHDSLRTHKVELLVGSNIGTDNVRLLRLPVSSHSVGTAVEVVGHENEELEGIVVRPGGKEVLLAWNVRGGRSRLTLLDSTTWQERDIETPPEWVISQISFTVNGEYLVFSAEAPWLPPSIWAMDVETGMLQTLASQEEYFNISRVFHHEIRMQMLDVETDDGLTINGWLYTPDTRWPWPLMIYLHGGPESQERPGYAPLFQALADQGIAVFAPNVRGSSGYGRKYLVAAEKHQGFSAVEDVTSCVNYLVNHGLAIPEKVGCMGRSYGGYLTLASLVWRPEMFAVGIDVCGMSNLETFYENTESWIKADAYTKYGHPIHDKELLRKLSPLHEIDNLKAPLMVVHGEKDTNVPVIEAQQLVHMMRNNDHPCSYMYVSGEGHVFVQRNNRQRFIDEVVNWCSRYLKD